MSAIASFFAGMIVGAALLLGLLILCSLAVNQTGEHMRWGPRRPN